MFWFIAEVQQPSGVLPNRPNRRLGSSALQERDQLAWFAKAGFPQATRHPFWSGGLPTPREHYTEGDFRQVHAVIEVAAFDAKGIVS